MSVIFESRFCVPKMVIAYNRRKQGSEFLKSVLGPLLKNFITKDLNLELKPQNVEILSFSLSLLDLSSND